MQSRSTIHKSENASSSCLSGQISTEISSLNQDRKFAKSHQNLEVIDSPECLIWYRWVSHASVGFPEYLRD
jgi:hypothetical protein